MGELSCKPPMSQHGPTGRLELGNILLHPSEVLRCNYPCTPGGPSQALRHDADHEQGHIFRDQPPSLCKLHLTSTQSNLEFLACELQDHNKVGFKAQSQCH